MLTALRTNFLGGTTLLLMRFRFISFAILIKASFFKYRNPFLFLPILIIRTHYEQFYPHAQGRIDCLEKLQPHSTFLRKREITYLFSILFTHVNPNPLSLTNVKNYVTVKSTLILPILYHTHSIMSNFWYQAIFLYN